MPLTLTSLTSSSPAPSFAPVPPHRLAPPYQTTPSALEGRRELGSEKGWKGVALTFTVEQVFVLHAAAPPLLRVGVREGPGLSPRA
ncbi:hypothetical protein E2C01_056192 [Portunus trituberculatus]|uniref:Uncharacterized protein n=1 Tax=Portunus trituberculatus TaxID=210409 RepID=A0A5B7GX61_PORTR|nr:hypothetical protein [Portunus trituberculatus]